MPKLDLKVAAADAALFHQISESGIFPDEAAIITTAFNLLRPHFQRFLEFRAAIANGQSDIAVGLFTRLPNPARPGGLPWVITESAAQDAADLLHQSYVPEDARFILEDLRPFAERAAHAIHHRERSYLPGITLVRHQRIFAALRFSAERVEILRLLDENIDVPEPGCESDEM